MYIKRKSKWAQVKQDAFDEIKRIVACEPLLTYPYFFETFEIYTNARVLSLGAFIIHKDKPIALYSRKLNDAQQQYTGT